MSFFPERIFYLTSERNILHSFLLHDQTKLEICHIVNVTAKTLKYLTLSNEKKYAYVKTFNEDIYIVLANEERVDVIEPNNAGKPVLKHSIIVFPATFLGICIFADNINEYLMVHDTKEPMAVVFTNMSARNILEEQKRNTIAERGNPIMDVFIEAYERFGEYTYGEGKRKMNFIHLTNIPLELVQLYADEQCLNDHNHKVLSPENTPKILDSAITILSRYLMDIIQTRIPVQICTI
jgi:hypothetical protein